MSSIDLKTDDGLKAACAEVRSRIDPEQVAAISAIIREIRDAPAALRADLDFQVRIWQDVSLWRGGLMMRRRLDPTTFLEEDGLHQWFADKTTQSLPENPDRRVETLTKMYGTLIERVERGEYGGQPRVEALRTMALFFPEDFTALAYPPEVVSLARAMDFEASEDQVVRAHRNVLDRLQKVLESPADGVEGRVERMILPYQLYRLLDPRLWVVRAGSRGQDEEYVLNNEMAMLGFEKEPAPTHDTYEEYREAVRGRVLDRPKGSADSAARQVWDFGREIGAGDIIVLPQMKGDRHIAWGTVEGRYEHREAKNGARHTLPVKWVRKDIPETALGADKKTLARRRTVFSLQKDHARRLLPILGISASDDDPPGPRPAKTSIRWPFDAVWSALSEGAEKANLRFDRSLVEALHLGLWADEQRHFAVLSGLSGTGKTQVALRYALALTGAESDTGGPVEVISVHPGWHDPGPLLGYVNPLTGGYTRTEFLDFLLAATENPDQPHVLILDEMNLSHPEQYFAPILSAMEIRGGEIPLHREDEENLGVPRGVAYPSNLVIIGTVNMDETTMGISDKVLDRAFTLEFWDIDPERWPGWDDCAFDEVEDSKVRAILTELTEALSPARRHFGWRVIKEVVGFLEGRSRDSGIELTAEDALDQVIYAKVLPKLRGSDTDRFRKCLDATLGVLEEHGLKRCAAKVKALKEDLEASGSCSFWR